MHRSNSDIPPMNPKTKKPENTKVSDNIEEEAFNFDDTDEFVPENNFQFGKDKGWQPA